MGVILKTDVSTQEVQPRNGTDFSWDELHDIVNGYIEIIDLRNGQIMVINEEGKLENLPYNALATNAAIMLGAITFNDYIVGDVLVCDSDEVK